LRAAFFLQTAINTVPLLLALLVVPLWKHSSNCSSSDADNDLSQLGSESSESRSDQDVMLSVVIRGTSCSSCYEDYQLHTTAAPAADWAMKVAGTVTSQIAHTAKIQQPDSVMFSDASAADNSSSGGFQVYRHKDSFKILHLDSACDMENLRSAAATAVKQCSMSSTDVEYGTTDTANSWPSITDGNVQLQKQQQSDETNKEQHSSSSSGGLDICSVLSTIADPVVFSNVCWPFWSNSLRGRWWCWFQL
jgi:hypothetical protein